MTYQIPGGMPPYQPYPPQTPGKKRHIMRNILLSAAGLLGLFIIIGIIAAATAGKTPPTSPAAAVSTSAPPAAVAAPVPVPSPDGTYQGACNYNLGSDPVGGTAVATGDVQVTNTGSIGTIIRVRITWPQQGYDPLAMTRVIRLNAGGSTDVQFHRPLSFDQLTNLQNWQTGHGYADGCTYKATITGTFGTAG